MFRNKVFLIFFRAQLLLFNLILIIIREIRVSVCSPIITFTDAAVVYFFFFFFFFKIFFFFFYKFSFSVQDKISALKNIRRSSITRRGNYHCIFFTNIVSFFFQFFLLISIYVYCVLNYGIYFFLQFSSFYLMTTSR